MPDMSRAFMESPAASGDKEARRNNMKNDVKGVFMFFDRP